MVGFRILWGLCGWVSKDRVTTCKVYTLEFISTFLQYKPTLSPSYELLSMSITTCSSEDSTKLLCALQKGGNPLDILGWDAQLYNSLGSA